MIMAAVDMLPGLDPQQSIFWFSFLRTHSNSLCNNTEQIIRQKNNKKKSTRIA